MQKPSIPCFLARGQLIELFDFCPLDAMLVLGHESLRLVVADDCPVAALEELRDGIDGDFLLL